MSNSLNIGMIKKSSKIA